MTVKVVYAINTAPESAILEHLKRCDSDFVPQVSSRVNITEYVKKICTHAERFEAWIGNELVGLVAGYCNDRDRGLAFITSVSTLKSWTRKGIAGELIDRCVLHAKKLGMRQISLEVGSENAPAIKLYESKGFTIVASKESMVTMLLSLDGKDHG